ncbi:MAG TPA: glycosyltransferase [Acidimicrobiia bacterium]|nr:glycosyltransferase [Acidimicrobiia bacterium]
MSNRAPAVTVHVPCHDYGRFLGDALDSLLAQTRTDWEAVVTDDASTDDSAAVMASYDDPRLRFVHHRENAGHVATYNEALALARAPRFVVLSADDRYHPAFLERACIALDADPAIVLAFTDAELIDEHGAVIGVSATTLEPDRDWVRDVSLELMFRAFVPGGAAVVRTELLRARGGFDPTLPHTTDTFLWRQLAFRGPIAHLAGRQFQQRIHDAALHHSTSWLDLMTTEEVVQYERLLADPAVPARVVARRARLDAIVSVHRARRAHRDRRPIETVRQLARAVGRDPWVWERDHPIAVLARDQVARRRS